MSEYQCYEFIALDRQLTSKEMAELRAISTRADISPTRFWNEYHWGDLKADPAKLADRFAALRKVHVVRRRGFFDAFKRAEAVR